MITKAIYSPQNNIDLLPFLTIKIFYGYSVFK
jgi:hypothetical protein